MLGTTQGYVSYEQLKVVYDMNNSRSSGLGCKFFEQLKIVDDINYFKP